MREIVKIDNNAFFTTYFLEPLERDGYTPVKRPLLLILPGGAYRYVSPRESEPVALRANTAGFHAIVLNYTVLPQKPDLILEDLLKEVGFCLDWAAEHAEQYLLDMEQVSVMGFSAGGHLAAWSSIRFANRFKKAILAYAAVGFTAETMRQAAADRVKGFAEGKGLTDEEKILFDGMLRLFRLSPIEALSEDVPPTFLFSTMDDTLVPVVQSFRYAERLLKKGVPCEAHFFEKGGHGLSLANELTACFPEQLSPRVAPWFDTAMSWLKS